MITLRDQCLHKLAEMRDAEHQTVRVLPQLALVASSPDLTRALLAHIKESERHATVLDRLFECFGAPSRSATCEVTSKLLSEGDRIAATFKGSPSINAAIITTAQRIQQYAMTSCDRVGEWAALLGNTQAANLLHELQEAKRAFSETLSKLAHDSGVPPSPRAPIREKSFDVKPRDSDNRYACASQPQGPATTRRLAPPPTAPRL
jgi:ferritin-like metal-binding protein YciE